MNHPLVLGSSSRYRAQLLTQLGVPFTQERPDVDERAFDPRFDRETSAEFALTLARAKADALIQEGGRRWLLCADQVGVLEAPDGSRRQLSKPGTPDRCVEQLMELSGRTHALVNGLVLVSEATGQRFEAVDRQELTMRPFGRAEAASYVERFSPLDCAGGYRIEDEGIRLFERIRSDDHTGIIGLPLLTTAHLLRQAGILSP
ncbi:MAG: Maf family protein [Planctomycetes bacterium]|nr:Maf family protein [Planctomycetota bacterium]